MPLIAETPFQVVAAALDAAASEAGALAIQWFRAARRPRAHRLQTRRFAGHRGRSRGRPVPARAADRPVSGRRLALRKETADPARNGSGSLCFHCRSDRRTHSSPGRRRWSVSAALVRARTPGRRRRDRAGARRTFRRRAGHGARRQRPPLDLSAAGPLSGGRLAGPSPARKGRGGRRHDSRAEIPSLALRFAHVAGQDIHAAVSSANSHGGILPRPT